MTTSNDPFSSASLLPQEEILALSLKKGKLVIGMPKECEIGEQRVCLTPDAVTALIANEHQVIVEKDAGLHAHFSNEEYLKAGAQLVDDKKKVFECPLILKVAAVNYDEIALLKPNSTVISNLNIKTKDPDFIKALQKKNITAIAMEYITEHDDSYPIVRSLSEITGTAAVHIAAELMSSYHDGKGQLFGNISGVPPTEVVVFGSDNTAIFAAKAALDFGASVKLFDNSISKLRKIQTHLKHPIYTSTLQPKNILKALRRCDVAIGAINSVGRTPIVVSDDMVAHMKKGSVIIDACIDNGGCFETSELTTLKNPVYRKYGVIHYCVPNIPSRYPKTASVSMSNIITPFLLEIAEKGGVENALRIQEGLKNGVYLYHGILTQKSVGDWFQIPTTNINLLIY